MHHVQLHAQYTPQPIVFAVVLSAFVATHAV